MPAPTPSPPSTHRSTIRPGHFRRRRRAPARFADCVRGLAGALSSALLVVGCASTDADVPARSSAARSPYLLPPTDGWQGPLDDAQRAALAAGFAALERDGGHEAALATADELVMSSGSLPPAQLLAAQAELAAGSPERARARLAGWIGEHPAYRAARLLWARLLELGADPAGAHAEYRAWADSIPIAAQRARATREPAVAAARATLDAAIAGGRFDQARGWLDRLAEWEPADSMLVLEARLALARALGDGPGELAALRGLQARGGDRRDLLERLAALELEHGDADQALRLFEGLVARYPADPSLESLLAAAQVRFRMRLLPDEVQRVASRGELARGDFAALLYWIVPGVRQTQGGSARIATDVLDHRWQQEIIRVVNRGLMRVDPALHRFEPDRAITRIEALGSAIQVAAERPGGGCVRDATRSPSAGAEFVCGMAARCGLLDDVGECLPQATLSGGDALSMLGRALSLAATE